MEVSVAAVVGVVGRVQAQRRGGVPSRGRVSGRGGRGSFVNERRQRDRLGGPERGGPAARDARAPRPEEGPSSVALVDPAAAAEQVAVVVLSERAGNAVQGNGVDARVHEAQAEADDPEGVPEAVELDGGERVQVEPQQEHMGRQEAHGEDEHEAEHDLGDLPPRPPLPVEDPRLSWHVVGGQQVPCHQQVEGRDDHQRQQVIEKGLDDDVSLRVPLGQVIRERVTYADRLPFRDLEDLHVREHAGGSRQ